MFIVVAVVAVLALGALALLVTARGRAKTGRLSRSTRRADASAVPPGAEPSSGAGTEAGSDVEPVDAEARARGDESRRAAESGSLVAAGERGVVRYEPIDEEELGVTRRQLFNRGILAGLGLSASLFGVAAVGFLWGSRAGGGGVKVTVGSVGDVEKSLADKVPFYNASAKTYILAYPKSALPKAKQVYESVLLKGMAQGYVALYQKCPHLGCRVPWCQTSQWFECPCHGSKYNRVGEKRGGPAPRGMDRFPLEVAGNDVIVDTTIPIPGPPIGTDTTGQGQEGAPCV